MDKGKYVKKYWLIIVALIPFLILTVFYFYTKEAREDLSTMKYPRKMYPVGIDTVNLGAGKYRVDSVYYAINNFNFVNQYNQEITKEVLHDKIIVANFFSVNNTTVSPKISQQLARIQSEMIRDDRVVLLSFTTEPLTDSISVLKQYAQQYGAIPGKWHFLNGSEEQIVNLANDELKLAKQMKKSLESSEDIINAKQLILLDPNWNIRGYYDGSSENKVNILMGDILLLQKEFKR
ncbi:MAG: SCO family protein [Bacteroidetes bacterium]|nr:SCO family protein [Bacteroidota bacterium]MCB9226542.1 SCO family protein [Chitinophagales bacterium]